MDSNNIDSIIIDLSGTKGLVERHQGDLLSTTSNPNRRYLGAPGQVADGVYNPIKVLGYVAPANNVFTVTSHQTDTAINAMVVDDETGDLYISNGTNVIEGYEDVLDGAALTDITITSGHEITDIEVYEINGNKALFFLYTPGTGTETGVVGWKILGSNVIELASYPVEDISSPFEWKIGDVGSVGASFIYRKLTQRFLVGDFGIPYDGSSNLLGKLNISSVSLPLKRTGTNGSAEIKISIQGHDDPLTSPYSYEGAWGSGVSYNVDDTVLVSGVYYLCHVAHTSGATSQPTSGSAWEDYWSQFTVPDGVEAASVTVDFNDIPTTDETQTKFTFTSPTQLTTNSRFYIVLEEVGSNLTAGQTVSWYGTVNDGAIYDRNASGLNTDYSNNSWETLNPNGSIEATATEMDNLAFVLQTNIAESWSNSLPNGYFSEEGAVDIDFLHRSDNNLLYWFHGNKVHSFDGSVVGGTLGRAIENTLQFPSYVFPVGVAETRTRMYIAIQSTSATEIENLSLPARTCGVFVWDRRAQVVGATDFYYAPGAKEIKDIFVGQTGDVYLITIGNSGYSELRGISGNQYAVLQTFERDGWPNRRCTDQLNGMTTWLGQNKIWYAFGEVAPGAGASLYKIGDASGTIDNTGFTSGPILVADYNSTYRSGILYAYTELNNEDVDDSYSETNANGGEGISDSTLLNNEAGQTFVSDGGYLTKAKFYLKRNGTTTGNIKCHIKATSAGAPTGAALEATANKDVTTISNSAYELVEFTFAGTTLLTAGTTYYIGIDDVSMSGAGIFIGTDSSSPSHSGSAYLMVSGAFSVQAYDICFYVYISNPYRLGKWYPHGEGTIDSVTQTANIGNVYTLVNILPQMSTVRYVDIRNLPTTSSGSTIIATVKYYFNQSSTASITKSITLNEAVRGYARHEINTPYVNSIQMEIEFNTTQTLGSDDFLPVSAVVYYSSSTTATMDNG